MILVYAEDRLWSREHTRLWQWVAILQGPHDEGVDQVAPLPDGFFIGCAMGMLTRKFRDRDDEGVVRI